MRHHDLLRAGLAACVCCLPALAQSELVLEPFAAGLDAPLDVAGPPGDAERLFVVEQDGVVRLFVRGVERPTPFLDLSAQVFVESQTGCLGFAVHPDYATNGWVYAHFSTGPKSTRLARYTRSASDPDVVDPGSETVLLDVQSAVEFHQGGGLAFGPDGKLYVAVGDQRELPGSPCTAQSGDVLLGKILRLDDDGSIPSDNPYVGDPGVLDPIFAFGLRMPFRIAFDPLAGDLLVFDVGESDTEELDLVPFSAAAGANFGWRVVEGTHCTGSPSCAAWPCRDPSFVDPVVSFEHTHGRCCIIGGVLYRGREIPSLAGQAVYADWCTGTVFSALVGPSGLLNLWDRTQAISQPGVAEPGHPTSLGVDGVGELYLVDGQGGQPGQGVVYRFVGQPSPFLDLGHGLEGIFGTPSLGATGSLDGGTPLSLRLSGADVSTTCALVIGFSILEAPFKGGVLVPAPDLVLAGLPVDDQGKLTLGFSWPTGVPPGVTVFFQEWIADSLAPFGYSASNGLQATTP